MTTDTQPLSEISEFLDRAWSDYSSFRQWQTSEKTVLSPESDSARDDWRLLFQANEDASFLLGVRAETKQIRVGVVTRNRWVSEGVEQAVLDNGGSMTEFLEDEMEADDDLEYPMLHYHDSGEFYFVSEIPFEDIRKPETYEMAKYYFEGYVVAMENRLEEG